MGCQMALLFICYENEKTLTNIKVYNQVEKLQRCPNKHIELKLNYIIKSGLTEVSCIVKGLVVIVIALGQLYIVWKSSSPNKIFDISLAGVLSVQALYLAYIYLILKKYVYDYIEYVEDLIKKNEENEENQ